MPVNKLLIITGTTASGKTVLSLDLANKYNTDIISADSLLVYKYLDIGTAKPSKEEQLKIKHHLIDIIEPNVEYTNSEYSFDCKKIIDSLTSENKKFIVAGGTGFYINAIINGTFETPQSIPDIKKNIEARLNNGETLEDLYNELSIIDPDIIKIIHKNDKYRIIRALEVIKISGKTMSYFKNLHQQKKPLFNPLLIVLHLEKEELIKRIKTRIEAMITNGLIDEVQNILKRGYSRNLKPLRSIGYNQIIQYLNNEINLLTAKNLIIKETTALAKRQVTWFKKQKNTKWYHPDRDINCIYEDISNFINLE